MTDQPQKPTDPTEGAKPRSANVRGGCIRHQALHYYTPECVSFYALSSLRGERDRLRSTLVSETGKAYEAGQDAWAAESERLGAELSDAESRADGMARTVLRMQGESARLEAENADLRARTEKAEAEARIAERQWDGWMKLANESMRALDSAREALRGAVYCIDNHHDFDLACDCDPAIAARAAIFPARSSPPILSSAPPAPAPAPLTAAEIMAMLPPTCRNCHRPAVDHPVRSGCVRCEHFSPPDPPPAQREDAPTRECPCENPFCPDRHADGRTPREAPAPDLEGLIRETWGVLWRHVQSGRENDAKARLRSFADSVARLTREPLEKERDQAIAHDRQPYPTAWAYAQACKALAEAERKLSEIVYEHGKLLADCEEKHWPEIEAARRDTWEKAIKAQCNMCANGSPAVRRNSVTYIHNITTDHGPYICQSSSLHAARAQEDARGAQSGGEGAGDKG